MTAGGTPIQIGGRETARLDPTVVGSKAAQLAMLARLGLDVPPAFVLPTMLCARVDAGDAEALAALDRSLGQGIAWLEDVTGRRFGDDRLPLLVSVRSGAPISMPGMLDSILNIGLNDRSVHGLIRASGNPRLGFDSYRRLVQAYAEIVDGAPRARFEQRLAELVRFEKVCGEPDLDPEALERLANDFRDLAHRLAGRALPEEPREQLRSAAIAVYRSWYSRRASEYRNLAGMSEDIGTAVTVQAMVFGNAGGHSGSGVAFSRNPATGERALYIDFLFDAQGEDIVSGRRNPVDVNEFGRRLPAVAEALGAGARQIEREAGDAQDIEFTVERGRLYFLQTRSAKCAPRALLRIAVDLVHEGLIDIPTALARMGKIDVARFCVRRFGDVASPIATAVSAAPGVASGRAVFDSMRAMTLAAAGEPVILIRPDTSTEDVAAFAVADGILTARGGRTAHAAVVARQLGKVCLVACPTLTVDERCHEGAIGGHHIADGDWLSLDGDSGAVTLGRRTIVTDAPDELAEIEAWRRQAG